MRVDPFRLGRIADEQGYATDEFMRFMEAIERRIGGVGDFFLLGNDEVFTANTLIVRSADISFTEIEAGDGLVLTGATSLDVVGGDGITANANDVAVDYARGLTITSGQLEALLGTALDFDTNAIAVQVTAPIIVTSNALDLDIGVGLTLSTGVLVVDYGDGLTASGNQIIANLGNGVEFNGAVIQADLGAGLAFNTSDIDVQVGDGIEIVGNALTADVGDGLELTGGEIAVNEGDGLTFSTGVLVVNAGNGLEFNSGALQADLGDGLAFNGSDIEVSLGDGLQINTGAVEIDEGQGLEFSSGTLQIKSTGAFHVNRNNVDQTGITTATDTKVEFDTEVFDVDGWFDPTTNYRYTPLVAGKYLLYAQVLTTANIVDGNDYFLKIYKNGSAAYTNRVNAAGTGNQSVEITALVDMNGSTDYVEIFFRGTGAGDKTVSGDVANTFFCGFRVCP